MVSWREGYPLVSRGSLLEYMEEQEHPRRNWVTEVHMEKRPLNGSYSSK